MLKERNIDQFFLEKYLRVNKLLEQTDKETDKAATRARSSVRNYGAKLLTDQKIISQFQGSRRKSPV